MKLNPSYLKSTSYKHPEKDPLTNNGPTVGPQMVTLVAGSGLLMVSLIAVAVYIYRRKSWTKENHTTLLLKKSYPNDRPLSLRRPAAVKSPSSTGIGQSANSGPGGGPTLKKSPSPTGQKSPPGNPIESQGEKRSPSLSENLAGNNYPAQGERKSSGQKERLDLNLSEDQMKKTQSQECDTNEESSRKETIQVADFGKLGKLNFKLKYNYEKHALCVTVVKCVDLPPRDSNCGSSDPYVKLQLLPEKQHKVKTRVLRKTLNPVYDEDFTFYGITPNQLETITLHFVVLCFDRYSRDDIIGEVIFHLGHLQFDSLEKQISLEQEISPRSLKIRQQGRGEILVSLCYQPAANRLTVVVLKARNLPKMDVTGLCDPYVKIYLLYNNQRISKKKTHVKKKTTNPVFNESFVFDVPYNEGLDNLSLEFLLLDYDRVTKNEVIGKLEIGPKASGTALKHWKDVAASPRRQIAEWHKL